MWDSCTSPDAKRAYCASWPHVLGAAGISLGLYLLVLLFVLTMGRNITVDWGRLVRSLLIVAMLGYLYWPEMVEGWRRRAGPAQPMMERNSIR